MSNTTIVLTMAGLSRRFADAGYTAPKYKLCAHGRTVFSWAVSSLMNFIGGEFICIMQRSADATGFVEAELRRLGVDRFELIELDGPTDGQATTALLAAPAIERPDHPVAIYNIDTFCDPSYLRGDLRGAGWIPCFSAPGSSWSFVVADEKGRVSRTAEKQRLSDDCSIGLYWFDSFERYGQAYHATYDEKAPAPTSGGERHVAPMYNSLIADGEPVYLSRVPQPAVVPIGTPAEYEAFVTGAPLPFPIP